LERVWRNRATSEGAPVVRQGRYWYGEAVVNSRTDGVWVVVTNLGVVRGNPDRVQWEVRSDFVAQTPETLIYDGDGNLVRDGRWMYSWDAENRLVRVMSYGATDRASWRRVDWAYDALGRRIRQTSYVLSNGVWVVTEDLKFVSDPVWFGRHIAELNATNHAVVRSYVWGLDLSETLDGAGGVGGLLWVRLAGGPASGAHFVSYDGNGNVWQLVSASTGTETARYEYGPFGEPFRATGPAAPLNPFRFSTKRTDPGTGLVLYEYRVYSPSMGRWTCMDPINERGSELINSTRAVVGLDEENHLYACVHNNPVITFDPFGLYLPPQAWPQPPPLPPSPPDDWYDPLQAAACFCKNYRDMRKANTIGADKYFHCLAHCCSAKKGAKQTAAIIGLARELCDICRNKSDNLLKEFLDSMSDMEANQHGLNCPKDKSCKDWCAKYRPKGLDPKY
jgi:RHS repeat-associated protein